MSLLNQWIRIFHDDNGTLKDISLDAQTNAAIDFPYVAAEDFLYIGQVMPFNNIFFEVDTPNAAAAVATVQYWNNTEWKDMVDLLDGTSSGGVSFAQDGVMQYSPDDEGSQWISVDDTRDESSFGNLNGIALFDLYWLRIKWNVNLDAGTKIKKISYAFCNDEMLEALEPDIEKYKTSWGGTTKTDWVEQIILSSHHLAADLKSRNIITHPGNILRLEDIAWACAWRTLQHIYSMLGRNFNEKQQIAKDNYEKLLTIKRFTIDKLKDGRVEPSEIARTVVRGIR